MSSSTKNEIMMIAKCFKRHDFKLPCGEECSMEEICQAFELIIKRGRQDMKKVMEIWVDERIAEKETQCDCLKVNCNDCMQIKELQNIKDIIRELE